MVTPVLSAVAQAMVGSASVENRRRADALAAAGRRIYDLGIGEPDADTPAVVKAAAHQAIDRGEGHYVDPRGLQALRERIVRFERERHGLTIQPEQVVVTVGSLGALSITLCALLDPGDEVVIFEPFWGPYAGMVKLAGGVPVTVPARETADALAPDFDAFAARLTARTRAVVLNSPNNPSGKVWSAGLLARLANLCEARNLWIVSDEVYSELVYDDHRHVSIATLSAAAARRTIITTSLSKSFAMTGWRLGYCVAAPEVAAVLAKINHYTVRCATSIAQWAAIAAFDDADRLLGGMRCLYARRRDLVGSAFARFPEFRYRKPDGSFYAFVRLPDYLADARVFVERLLEEEGVVVGSGAAYGASCHRYIRLSFATDDDTINEGIARIGNLALRMRQPASNHVGASGRI